MRLATQLVASYPMRAQHWHALVKQKKERQINILQDLQDDTTIEPRMPTNQGYSAANEEFVMDMSKSDGRSPRTRTRSACCTRTCSGLTRI